MLMMKIKMTEDVGHREKILDALRKNDGYCPCVLEKVPETKCMCKDFKEMQSGTCHCGLYIKEVTN